MKRVLNALIISGFAATLACAPASRKQTLPQKPAASNQKPVSNSTPAAGDGSGSGSQNQPDPSSSQTPTANPAATPAATDPKAADAALKVNGGVTSTTDPVSFGDVAISQIEFKALADGSFTLTLVTKDGDVEKTSVIKVETSSSVTEGDGTSGSTFICAIQSAKNPADCTDSTLAFTLNGQQLSAHITKDIGVQVNEGIQIPSGEGYIIDKSVNRDETFKSKVGTADVRKVVLTDGSAGEMIGFRASFRIGDASDKGEPDDILVSKDSNKAIRIFGLPTVDLKNGAIKTIISKKDGKTVPRQAELVSLYLEKNSEFSVRYSVGITTADGKSKLLVLETAKASSAPASDSVTPPAAKLAVNTPAAADSSKGAQPPADNAQPATTNPAKDPVAAAPAPEHPHDITPPAAKTVFDNHTPAPAPAVDTAAAANAADTTSDLPTVEPSTWENVKTWVADHSPDWLIKFHEFAKKDLTDPNTYH